jgi:RNA polymerase sigma-70 factor (ECF subfamily)
MQAVAECPIHPTDFPMSEQPRSDVELVEAIRAGNRSAFKDLYDRYAPKMYRLAWRYHGRTADAEDAVQEAFINAYKNISGFRGRAQVSTWLYRITVNACISWKRKNQRYSPVDDYPENWDNVTIQQGRDQELQTLLNREILALKKTHRMVFLLFAVEGLSHAEIAETLGISENTSKSHYRRARLALMKRLKRLGITEKELIQ